MSNTPQYFKKLNEGISSFFTLIVCNNNDEITINNQVFNIHGGNMLLLKEGIRYTFKNGHCEVFNYPEEFFDYLFYSQIRDSRFLYEFISSKQSTPEYLFFEFKKNSEAFRSIGQIKDCFKVQDVHTAKLLHLSLIATLTHIQRSNKDKLVYQKSNLKQPQTFGAVIGYMGANYAHINCKSTAEYFGYHPDYFSSFFKKVTGISFSEKLLDIRIEEAKKYLVTTTLKVEEIITLVGFKERSFFMKKFKEKEGCTPLKYRKKMLHVSK